MSPTPPATARARVASMTGFGAAETPLLGHTLRVELRSVNHRHLDVRVRASAELGDCAQLVEDAVRARCGRGRIEAQATWDGATQGAAGLDVERARRVYQQLLGVRDAVAPDEPVPLSLLFSVPGLFATRLSQRDEVEAALRHATERAVDDLLAMRAREGAVLAADVLARAATVRSHVQAVSELRPLTLESAQRRLTKRVEKLLEGSALAIDPARLAQEVAWFAERSDVAEELTRLGSHLDELERTIGSPSDSVGRKLDFLLQEIARELNTLGAKANDAEISRRVVEMKAELERIREQVQNIL